LTKKTKIIAEVASNHGGDLKLAKEFIKVAARVGVDYVKFQSWQAKNMKRDDPQYEWFVRSELSDEAHYELIEECNKRGVEFLTTCFSLERIDFLANLGLEAIKIGSPDAGSHKMLREIKGRFKRMIISTGMSYEDELIKTAQILEGQDFTLLHCVSVYPTPLERINMSKMKWLRRFTPSVGYSDHSLGIEAVKLAIAWGVDYIEKHFCLGKEGSGRVAPWDASPEEMEEIVMNRDLVLQMAGEGDLELSEEEEESRRRFIGRFGDNR